MIGLRDFSWRYFTLTGDIDAYLLYKKHEQMIADRRQPDVEEDDLEPNGPES